MNKLPQELAIIFLGIVTTLVVTALLVFVDIRFNHALYTFSLWIIFPIGAIGAGFLSGGGYFFGSKLFNRRPGKMILASMIISAFATYFLVHYFTYYFVKAEGGWLREYMKFSDYIRASVERSGLSIYHQGQRSDTRYTLGFWGYLFQLIYVVGFYLGGMLIYMQLQASIYCDRCSQYFTSKGKRALYSSDPKKSESIISEISALIAKNDFRGAVLKQSEFGTSKINRGDRFKSEVFHRQCKGCCQNFIRFTLHRQVGMNASDWKEVENSAMQFQTNDPVSLT